MGFVFSKIFSGLVGNDQMRIIIIGLDNAGKTTILCKLSEEINRHPLPSSCHLAFNSLIETQSS